MTPFVQGLYISAVGIVVLFITAVIFYFLLVVLQKLFPGRKEKTVTQAVEPAPQAVSAAEPSPEDEELAAAIAIAIQNTHRLQTRGSLGEALQAGRGPWWSAGLLAARQDIRTKK